MCPGAPGSWAPFAMVRFACGSLRRVRSKHKRFWASREEAQPGGSWVYDGFDFGDWRLLEIYLFVVHS